MALPDTTTFKLENMALREAKERLFPIDEYERQLGVKVNFNKSYMFPRLIEQGDKVFVFEQPTEDKNVFMHSILIVGAYNAILAGQFAIVNMGDRSELAPYRNINFPSVEIEYEDTDNKRVISNIGYNPDKIKGIVISFSAKDLT